MNPNPPNALHNAGINAAADTLHAAMRFLRAVRRHRKVVMASVAVFALLGAVYYLTATRIYKASASLLVLHSGGDVWNPTMTSDGPTGQGLLPTYERLFSSSVVLDGAIEHLQSLPPQLRIDLIGHPPEEWKDVLRKNLSANSVRRTNLIEIDYRSKNPHAAEAIVSALVKSYLDFMDENHKNVSAEIVRILDDERRDIENRVTEKQNDLLALQREVRHLGIENGSKVVHPAVQRVVSLNEALVDVQQERLDLTASLAAIRAAVDSGADLRQHLISVEPTVGQELLLSGLGLNPHLATTVGEVERRLIEDRAKLSTLSAHLGDVHPQIVELRGSIENAERFLAGYERTLEQRVANVEKNQLGDLLMAMVEQKLAKAHKHEGELARQYTQAENEAVRLNDRMAQYTMSKRQLELLNNLHDTLLNRIANIDLKQDTSDVRVAVVSEPLASERPYSPSLSLVAVVCLLGGLGGGAVLVYVRDVLDDRFRTPEELSEQLAAPVMAMVRKLHISEIAGVEGLQVYTKPDAVESEAFRTLRTTLAFAGDELGRVAVTSSEPADGKTTVLANLGAACAQAGRKTLLVDADLRRPGLSRLFELRAESGLSNILRADDEVAPMCLDCIQPSGLANLDVLPCGPRPSDPLELLVRPRLAEILSWAETAYDQVLIDCPPVLAASDAATIGRLTDGMILVVHPEKNHRRVVLRAAENLTAMQVNLIGIVANQISHQPNDGYYGYGYGYGSGYGYGYGEDDDSYDDDHDRVEETARGDDEPATDDLLDHFSDDPRRAA